MSTADSSVKKKVTNALLEGDQVALREGIRLGNDRDEVNAGTKSFHNFDVKWLEAGEKITRRPRIKEQDDLRVTGGPDEVQASMNAKIALLAALGLLLLNHVRLMLVVNEVDNRRPRVPIVDVVTKARGVNDSKLDLELLLLKLGLDNLDLSQFVQLLVVASAVVFGRRQLG